MLGPESEAWLPLPKPMALSVSDPAKSSSVSSGIVGRRWGGWDWSSTSASISIRFTKFSLTFIAEHSWNCSCIFGTGNVNIYTVIPRYNNMKIGCPPRLHSTAPILIMWIQFWFFIDDNEMNSGWSNQNHPGWNRAQIDPKWQYFQHFDVYVYEIERGGVVKKTVCNAKTKCGF